MNFDTNCGIPVIIQAGSWETVRRLLLLGLIITGGGGGGVSEGANGGKAVPSVFAGLKCPRGRRWGGGGGGAGVSEEEDWDKSVQSMFQCYKVPMD